MKERFETFTVLINKISRNVRKLKNREMAEYGLRSTHVSCLYYLYSADALTAAELCERCEEDKATISRALEFLEAGELIVCECKTGKRYKSPWRLTEKGRDAAREIVGKVNAVLDGVGVGLTDEQRDAFYSYLTVISDRLEEATEQLD